MTDQRQVDAKMPTDRDSAPIQVLRSADSVNGTASATATDNVALPAGTQVVMVSCTEAAWIEFGASGVAITAAEAGAILIPGGGVVLSLNASETHVAYIRATANDAVISFSKMT
jgi:hypothetical protein